MIDPDHITSLAHLLGALLAGALIGLERTYHGRPAGFRTHALVCTASAVLMQLVTLPWDTTGDMTLDTVRIDPTRMAQGIMTGIGFLGAGVIIKEGLTVRGLTTAASIWITAAIGILVGAGLYFTAVVATVLVLGTLSVFRWIESIMPAFYYSRLEVRFHRAETLAEEALTTLIAAQGFSIANLNYAQRDEGKLYEYAMTVRTHRRENARQLAEALKAHPQVLEFQITPAGD